MRTRYFVLFVAYDGHGNYKVANEVLWSDTAISTYEHVEKLQEVLKGIIKADHVTLLHFIDVTPKGPPPTRRGGLLA